MTNHALLLTYCISLLAAISCSSKVTTLAPESKVESGSAIMWGNIVVDFKSTTGEMPLAVHLALRNKDTGELFRYDRYPKNPQTLAVFSLPAGNYTLDKVYIYSHLFGNISFDRNDDKDIWKFVARKDHLSYMGHIRIIIRSTKKSATANIERHFKFDEDYRLLQRYYDSDLYRRAQHIDGLTGQAIGYLGRSGTAFKSQIENRIPFRRMDYGTLMVTARINNQHEVEMILDTGCTKTLLRESLVRELNLEMDSARTIRLALADGTTRELPLVSLDTIELGSARVDNLNPAVCMNCTGLFSHNLLCNDFLNHYSVQIDNQHSQIILHFQD